MNNQLFLIGEMINDNDKRLKYKDFTKLDYITDTNIFILAQMLKEEGFSFEKLFLRYGRQLTLFAMQIAQDQINYKIKTSGKI